MDSLSAVDQLVRDRDVLRRPHAQVWPRVRSHGPALIQRWAEATIALSQVNAGPACIIAFWHAAGETDLALLLSDGEAAAELCRRAGAKAALACLEAVPAAIRLTGRSAVELAAWWQGLQRLAEAAPALVRGVAQRTGVLLAGGSGQDFADFVAAGLKATARDPARRAAFFALQEPMALALLERHAEAQRFGACERMLGAFAAGLWGGTPRIAANPGAAQRTAIASGATIFPAVYAGVAAHLAREHYRAACAHAQAHLAVPARALSLGQLRPLQVALVGLIEDARVETLAIRRHPGLRRLWAQFHQARPGGALTCTTLMARLARALLDPDYADGDGFVQKGVASFQGASARIDDPGISRSLGGLLGNDLGQMRLQFDAASFLVEPAYRDDNMHLWALPDTPDGLLGITVDAARPNPGEGGGNGPGDEIQGPRAREAGLDRGAVLATYPEWDRAGGVERPDWTVVRDTVPLLRRPGPVWAGDAALRAQLARLVRSSVVGPPIRGGRREDGEEIDLDAAIDAAVARRQAVPPDDRLYRTRRRRVRSLSTLVILDVSQSTAARDVAQGGLTVLEAERLAVAALASALDARGDVFALRAFASAGREDVRLTRIKDFAEPMGPVVDARLAGLAPGLSTRLGAALRHAGAELQPLCTTRKLVLVLTDGEPSDIDVADPLELVEDARRAVSALNRRGIDVFGLVIDPQGAGAGAAIFGRHNTMAVRRLEDLPSRLAAVYFRLSQR